jgi:hypothetical protein
MIDMLSIVIFYFIEITMPCLHQENIVSIYKVGEKVMHKKFGKGIITGVEKDDDDYKLEIVFNNVGIKRLMAAYANLEKIK